MKKEILVPTLLFFLGLIFIIINIILYFSRGNSWLIGKKLKIGAMILSLSGIIGCGTTPQPTCYEVPPSKEYLDSLADIRKKDSILALEKKIIDSLNVVEKQKFDSLEAAKKEHFLIDSIKAEQKNRIRCYVNHKK